MDTDEGEFIICGSSGSPEDAAFDELVGHIEDFMMSFDMEAALGSLPSSASLPGDHERHAVYRQFVERVGAALDAHVIAACPQYKSINEIGPLLQSRSDEISDDVWEFVSEGCFDYVTFDEQWKTQPP